jgi:CO/xanthine dehydrogenase FAD-binding subunit
MVSLDASMVLRSKNQRRTIGAEEFFVSYMTTALEPEELLTEIIVPALPAHTGWSYQEVSRRHGDFALAGAAAVIALDGGRAISHARLTLTGATPLRARHVEELLMGEKPSASLFNDAARRATENIEQDSDIHASAEYRRSACEALGRRALVQAAERAAARGTS